jgi:uncharacterized protein YuzE
MAHDSTTSGRGLRLPTGDNSRRRTASSITRSMRLTYDSEVDAAYLYLAEDIGAGEAKTQIPVDDDRLNGTVVLDLDWDGRVLGIEILGASLLLPHDILDELR